MKPLPLCVCALALGLQIMGCSRGSGNSGTIVGPDDPVPAGANVVLQWNAAALQSIRNTKPGPPMTARALAIVHTAMYDAWAAYDTSANGTRLGGTLRRPPLERTPGRRSKAMSYAAHGTLVDLYPTEKVRLDALMTTLGYDPADATRDTTRPAGVGNTVSDAILALRHTDGSNQLGTLSASGLAYSDYTQYQPLNPPIVVTQPTLLSQIPRPDHWQPLTFTNAGGQVVTPSYIGPFWGQVTPFALTSGSQFRPVPPAALNTQAFADQANEILTISAGLTDQQKCIAEYWADGPNSELPPGHWDLFAQFVSRRDGHTLDADAQLFFALTNAIEDAGIAVWDAKRTFDYCRPVTAIRFLYHGQTVQAWGGAGKGTVSIQGESWKPYQPDSFPTPPFPEYVSGHSAFSAAGAEVLLRFTGSDTFGNSVTIPRSSLKADPTLPAADATLSWATFSIAADEAGMSRRYGGIHFKDGDLNARAMGRLCGAQAFLKAQALWQGH